MHKQVFHVRKQINYSYTTKTDAQLGLSNAPAARQSTTSARSNSSCVYVEIRYQMGAHTSFLEDSYVSILKEIQTIQDRKR